MFELLGREARKKNDEKGVLMHLQSYTNNASCRGLERFIGRPLRLYVNSECSGVMDTRMGGKGE